MKSRRSRGARSFAALVILAALLATVAIRLSIPTPALGSGPAPVSPAGQRYIPPTATPVSSFKTCPDGTQAFLGSPCPAPQQQCASGEIIYASQVCPGASPAAEAAAGSETGAAAAGQVPPSGAASIPTVTLCGSSASFNPAIQAGVLAPAATVAVGQTLLCGAGITAGAGCQPAGEMVDFGDGSPAVVSNQLAGSLHSYSQPGSYAVTDTLTNCAASTPAIVTVVAIAGGPATLIPPAQQPQVALAAGSCSQPPAAPAGVTVTTQPDLFHALISWTDNDAAATGYQIGFGNGSLVGTAGSGVTQFSAGSWPDANTGTMDQVAPTGWWEFFSVTAMNACGASSPVWAQVRMPCPDGSAGDPQGNASNSCNRSAASSAG